MNGIAPDMSGDVKLGRYVLYYLLALVGITAAAFAFSALVFDLPRGLNIAIVFGSVAIATNKFTQDHRRLFTSSEKHRLSALCLAANIAFSLTVVSVILFVAGGLNVLETVQNGFASMELGLIAGIVAFLLIVYYSSNYLFLEIMNKIFLKRLQKTEARNSARDSGLED